MSKISEKDREKLSSNEVDHFIDIIIDHLTNPDRRLVFLCGAGVSMAAKLPGIDDLFNEARNYLSVKEKKYENEIKYLDLLKDQKLNIEDIINHIRDLSKIKKINKNALSKDIREFNFDEIDKSIGESIFSCLNTPNYEWKDLHAPFCTWIHSNYQPSDSRYPPEIFTTNYDLLFERSLEFKGIRYFDGFFGGIKPTFIPESVLANPTDIDYYIPRSWLRLWKMHGSVNWRIINEKYEQKIIRVGDKTPDKSEKCAIFPSREKVEESQLGPFGVFRERLVSVLKKTEVVLIVLGYSFRDEHINNLIKQAASTNSHLAILIFDYGIDSDFSNNEFFIQLSNCTVICPNSVMKGGKPFNWSLPSEDYQKYQSLFQKSTKDKKVVCNLGNFEFFVKFLNYISLNYPYTKDSKDDD